METFAFPIKIEPLIAENLLFFVQKIYFGQV
jgi:hypothetical protein